MFADNASSSHRQLFRQIVPGFTHWQFLCFRRFQEGREYCVYLLQWQFISFSVFILSE